MAAAALCLAASCDKVANEKEISAPASSGTLYATVESPATKTSMTVGSTSATVSWSENDIISVFNGIDPNDPTVHTQNACYKLQAVNAGVGTFAFESQHSSDKNAPDSVDDTVTPKVAVYCYRGIETNAYDPVTKIITHRLPSTQNYVEGSFDPYAYTMVAVSDGGTLNFKGAVGVLELNLTGTEIVKNIVIEGSNICYNGHIDVSTAEKIAAPVMEMYHTDGANENSIIYFCGDGVQLGAAPTHFYIVLPVGTHNLTFTINTKYSKMVKVANNVKIERATITPTQNLAYSSTTDAINISGNGLEIANCYVISAPGQYVFNATTPEGTEFTGTGYTADWVWATSGRWNKAEHDVIKNLISDIEYIDGKIYFSTYPVLGTYNVGNVIIGIFKDGDLKWSWHIWETLDPKDEVVAGSTFMDRNLGAMRKYDPTNTTDTDYTNASRGFYYQWGRKDPIVAPRGASAKYGEYTAATAFDVSKNWATRYITNTTVWANATNWNVFTAVPSGWTYSAQEALKYPTSMLHQNMFPSYAVGDTWPSEAEPCPFGYHVMTKEEAQALIDLGTGKWASVTGSARNGGVKIDDKLVLPFLAYRKATGEIGFNWKNKTSGETSNWVGGKYYTSKIISAGKATNLDITSAGAPNGTGFQNVTANLGMSVRCVKD